MFNFLKVLKELTHRIEMPIKTLYYLMSICKLWMVFWVPLVYSLEDRSLRSGGSIDNEEISNALVPKKFGNSSFFVD
ncbi:hypothetical protein MtrunA17_Chr5g0448451 [Medicago truncatula]|nr:hypothetical protein MtrunA17_Chr5g0448451 [Medicago truncatula]